MEYHLAQVDDAIAAQSSMDKSTLQGIASDIYITYRRVHDSRDKHQALQRLSDFAREKREEALVAGATDLIDPLWNCSALIESIAFVELKSLQGKDTLDGAWTIRGRLKLFMDQCLSSAANNPFPS